MKDKGLIPHLGMLVKLAYKLPTREEDVTPETNKLRDTWMKAYTRHCRKIRDAETISAFDETYGTALGKMAGYLPHINWHGYVEAETRDRLMAGAASITGIDVDELKKQ